MKLWLSISAVLVFAAGCAVGLLLNADRYCGQEFPAPAPAEVVRDAAAGESVVASMVDPYPDYPLYLVSGEDFYDGLGLLEEQRRKLEDLFAQHFEGVREVRRGMADLAAELREGVLAVLTLEQEDRFNEVQKRYSANKIRYFVGTEIAELREELGLRPEQEPAVYRHLYDAAFSRREAYRQSNCKDRNAVREQVKSIDKKLERSLMRELFRDQFSAYLKFQERKRCVKHKERGERGKKDGKDCAPTASSVPSS